MLQLSNVSWEVHRTLALNTNDGKVLDDAEAMKYWAARTKPLGATSLSNSFEHNDIEILRRRFLQSSALAATASAAFPAFADPAQDEGTLPSSSRLASYTFATSRYADDRFMKQLQVTALNRRREGPPAMDAAKRPKRWPTTRRGHQAARAG